MASDLVHVVAFTGGSGIEVQRIMLLRLQDRVFVSHVPNPSCVSQATEHLLHARSHGMFPQPATVDNPPQPVGESELSRFSWFARFSAPDDCLHYIAFQFPVGQLSTQDLAVSRHSEDSTAIKFQQTS